MAKSSKLYNKSPTISRDEDGKTGISRPTTADGENMGTEGNPLPGSGEEMPIHIKQFKDMHERHLQEAKDMHKRHEKEHEKLTADHAGLMGDTSPMDDEANE